MKKTLFPLLLLPLVLSLSSCGEKISNQEEVDTLKTLLSKQDLSPCYHKMFTSTFAQNYNVSSSFHEGNDRQTRFYSYQGGGAFGCIYEVNEDAYNEVITQKDYSFFDFLYHGNGGYDLLQSARIVAYSRDTFEDEESLQYLNFMHQFQVKFDQSNVQVNSVIDSTNSIQGSNPTHSSFNGKIEKASLFESISERTFSNFISQVNLYDGQRCCEILDRFYEATLRSLTTKTDKELSAFIQSNSIVFEQSESNTLVHFKVEDEATLAAFSELNILPGPIEGTLTFDSVNGTFTSFDYQIICIHHESDSSTGNASNATMEFKANGYSLNKKFDQDLSIRPNPTIYEDANVFLKDMGEAIYPPVF